VQASSDASALERLGGGELLPHVHETWHLMLGDFDLLTAKGGKGDICIRPVVIREGRSSETWRKTTHQQLCRPWLAFFFERRGERWKGGR